MDRARQKLDNTLNNNTVMLDDSAAALSEEDGSQCFEDSLVGMLAGRRGLQAPTGAAATVLASPIREEDEQCLGSASSCDEPMRDVGTNSSTNSSSNSNSTGNEGNNHLPSTPSTLTYDSRHQQQQQQQPTPKINNFVGQRASPARRGELVGSESSGYISRQNSNDQINKSPNAQQFLHCAGNRRSVPKVGVAPD